MQYKIVTGTVSSSTATLHRQEQRIPLVSTARDQVDRNSPKTRKNNFTRSNQIVSSIRNTIQKKRIGFLQDKGTVFLSALRRAKWTL